MYLYFFNDTATTEIYTLSLHDALPIFASFVWQTLTWQTGSSVSHLKDWTAGVAATVEDRKSTRLNSSHANISYAVFCLKTKDTRSARSTPKSSGAKTA